MHKSITASANPPASRISSPVRRTRLSASRRSRHDRFAKSGDSLAGLTQSTRERSAPERLWLGGSKVLVESIQATVSPIRDAAAANAAAAEVLPEVAPPTIS